MFETYEAARLPMLPSFGQKTARWAFVAQSANREWFYVTHQYFQDGDPDYVCAQQFLIPDVIGLMTLVQSDSDSAFVSAVQLVSPGWLNGTDEWRMEPLKRLLASAGGDGSKYVYEVVSGSIYPVSQASASQAVGKIIWPIR